jgi:hypothetical protein
MTKPKEHLDRGEALRVTKMSITEYQEDGWTWNIHPILNPTWQQIEGAIYALNRLTRPFVWFYLDEKANEDDIANFEVIGGAGAYAMQGFLQEQHRRYINAANKGKGEVEIWTSDQGWNIPAGYVCFNLEGVLNATKYFCEQGTFDPQLTWE